MSSGGQIAGAVVGGVIGFYFGGPVGALQGAALGAGIGAALDPPKGPTVEGPRLSDLAVQTSTYGTFVPRLYGTVGVHGNLLWLENNKLKETVRKKKQGGKGGGSSTTVKTYSYSATFILALCQGPIVGIRRIWCADKLIYNAGSDNIDTIIASNQAAANFRLYLGTDGQMPDPRYEANVGAGNASAFRGIAYLAFYDFKLADYGNTLQAAQFKVEVVKAADKVDQFARYFEFDPGFNSSPSWAGAGNQYDAQGFANFVRLELDSSSPTWIRYNNGSVERKALGNSLFNPGRSILAVSNTLKSLSYAFKLENRYVIVGDSETAHAFDPGDTFSPTYVCEGESSNVLYVYSVSAFSGRKISRCDIDITGVYQEVSSVVVTGQHAIAYTGSKLVAASAPSDSGSITVDVYDELTLSLDSSFSVSSSLVSMINDNACGADYHDGILYLCPQISAVSLKLVKINLAAESLESIQNIDISISPVSSPNSPGFSYSNGIIYWGQRDGGESRLWQAAIQIGKVVIDNVQLSAVIDSETTLSSLLHSSDIDVSLVDDSVRGYRVQGGSIRSALEPLQAAFPFDVIQSGYKLKFVPRGQSSVASVPWDDLGASGSDTANDRLSESREMDTQLPARTTVKYIDASREYAMSEQYAERINTEAVNRVDRELPVVLSADEAAGVAEVLQFLPWLERSDISFMLPPSMLGLEPSDVITIESPEASYQVRLTGVKNTQAGVVECSAKLNRAALYVSDATGAEGEFPSGEVPLEGPTLWVPLDIPVIDETLQNSPGFVSVAVGYTDGWPGSVAYRSVDNGQTWSDIQGYTGIPTVGVARAPLPSSPCTHIDQRQLTVDLISGELDSLSRDQMLSGQNYAAYGVDGRWEIVRFQNAVQQANGSYLVSGFVRGEKGTEWASGLHQVGDYFVLLDDPDNIFIDVAVGSIGSPYTYRGVTLGAGIESGTDVPFTYEGVNLECLSPVYAKGSRDGSSNFSGNFTRRSRLSSSWWTTGVQAPLGEASEAYEIDVMSGSVVKRTILASSQSFSYSAADQTTDFGSAQSSITFRIYQISETVGRGYPLEVTL